MSVFSQAKADPSLAWAIIIIISFINKKDKTDIIQIPNQPNKVPLPDLPFNTLTAWSLTSPKNMIPIIAYQKNPSHAIPADSYLSSTILYALQIPKPYGSPLRDKGKWCPRAAFQSQKYNGFAKNWNNFWAQIGQLVGMLRSRHFFWHQDWPNWLLSHFILHMTLNV